MRAHTRKHHTESSFQIGEGDDIPMSADEAIKKICGDRPEWAVALRGLRYREGLTQKALGDLLGIEQTNISKMEQGCRPIGKTVAKRIAKIFKSDYRIFL
jgi:DNA-binding XRE family transcriptional regulator